VLALAKPALDVGLQTDRADELQAFYGTELGLAFDHRLPIRRGVVQDRFRLHGAVLKVNANREPLEDAPTGYRSLAIAGAERRRGTDPDGLPVAVVTDLDEGIEVAVTIVVADPDAEERFVADGLAAERLSEWRFRLGATELRIEHDASAERAGPMSARGFRYLTVQVHDVVAEHRRMIDLGFEEGMGPTKLGDVAAISFVRDPAGNWLEISQRASLTGPLPDSL
jgi:lactoylglutathione lyase